jgi:hypothetical protein
VLEVEEARSPSEPDKAREELLKNKAETLFPMDEFWMAVRGMMVPSVGRIHSVSAVTVL